MARTVARFGSSDPHFCYPGTRVAVEPGTTAPIGLVLDESVRAGDVVECDCGRRWIARSRKGLLQWRRYRGPVGFVR